MQQHLGRLLDLAGDGDELAFEIFYDLTSSKAWQLAQVAAREPSEPEDVLAHAYSRAWTQSRSFRSSGRSPISWLLCHVHAAARPELDLPCN